MHHQFRLLLLFDFQINLLYSRKATRFNVDRLRREN